MHRDDNPELHRVPRTRWKAELTESDTDLVVAEEPLEIQIHGHSIAVLMRTPGHDEDLVRGFLLTEGIIQDIAFIRRLQHCSAVPFPEAEDNVIQVHLHEDAGTDWQQSKRNFYASSSCGICGKASLEAVLQQAPPCPVGGLFSPSVIAAFPQQLQTQQATFQATGGSHAAGLFSPGGKLVCVREDVGRHNAVDKVIGAATQDASVPLEDLALMVSGRISFEIVQKAAMAGLSFIAGVSAPSSLAIATARGLGLTLVGFLRGESFSVYSDENKRIQ